MNYTEGFNDPVVRCDQCTKLTHRTYISKKGGCVHCGNKRFKGVHALNEDEITGLNDGSLQIGLKSYEIDPEFLKLFEPVGEVDNE